MEALPGRLAGLVRQLDSMREPWLTHLANELANANLTREDLAKFVHETPQSYHRALVVRRESYELLILTWKPGQGSVPHDHAGSISAMQVIQGEALEGSWRIAANGYVVREFETPVRRGEMTCWQDAGVHTVRNPATSETALVTAHVYCPPLKDFRRFVPRPATDGIGTPATGGGATVVVVGGGFSGAMTAAQVLRRAGNLGGAVRVCLVERQGAVGEGLAYSTADPAHLLNVPAGRMSAWPEQPDDFLQWVWRRHGPTDPGAFLPRQWYGEYVRETLAAVAHEAPSATLTVVFDEVRRIARRPDGGWMVNFARGVSQPADAVVLAIGHRPPPDPIGKLWSGSRSRFIADPWRAFAANGIGAREPVTILGTGLTAIDAVLTLSHEARQAPITMISRRGLLPQPHADTPVAPADLQPLVADLLATAGELRITRLCRQVRMHIRELTASGGDWRSVVDGLRPHTAALWRALPVCERRRFLAHVRAYWEVHRHRMALNAARDFGALLSRGAVQVIAGTVVSAQADEDGVRLYVRERGDHRLIELRTARIINCTGPRASNSAESNPAIGSLLVHGWVRPDELALGLDTTAEGNAIDAHGNAASDLFVVGTLRKPLLWESTAVPELRSQAAAVAECIVAQLRWRRAEARERSPVAASYSYSL